MATIQNLNNAHIAPETAKEANEAITAVEKVLNPFLVNLTPDERRRYGSISEQNKLLVNNLIRPFRNRNGRWQNYTERINNLVKQVIKCRSYAFDV